MVVTSTFILVSSKLCQKTSHHDKTTDGLRVPLPRWSVSSVPEDSNCGEQPYRSTDNERCLVRREADCGGDPAEEDGTSNEIQPQTADDATNDGDTPQSGYGQE